MHINLVIFAFLAFQARDSSRDAGCDCAPRRRSGADVNQVGGNDSLLFDGSSLALDGRGELIAQAASLKKTWSFSIHSRRSPLTCRQRRHEAAYRALVLGTRDYVRKCGFRKGLIALSGGIDSALVAAIASEALGSENVIAVGMPSPYSSPGSIEDSRKLAANLGIRFELIGISALFRDTRLLSNLCFAGSKAGLDRREYSVAHPRHADDGTLEQIWRAWF